MSTAQTSTVLGRLMAQMSSLTEAELTPPTTEYDERIHQIVGVLTDDQRRLWLLGKRATDSYNADVAQLRQMQEEIRAAQTSGKDEIDSLRKLAQGALSLDLVERYATVEAGMKPKALEHRLLQVVMDAEVRAMLPEQPREGAKVIVLNDWSIALATGEICPGCGEVHSGIGGFMDLGDFLEMMAGGKREEVRTH